MGVVIGRMDGQVEKIFLGNNLTRSTKNYAKILKDENLSEEEKQRILAAEKKKQEEDINKDERVKAIEIVNLIEQKKEGSQHGISK